jgi:hypothetical protein
VTRLVTKLDPAPEARSGLDPWGRAALPAPPAPRGLGWLAVVGPGVIILGASIGSGEFLLGPAVFVKYGLTLLWVTVVAILFQTIFNTEVMRYTVATGEPVLTGFMRTRPSSTVWAWFYAALFFLQAGWPAWAGASAAAIFFLFTQRLAGPADATTLYWIGIGILLACVAALSVGNRIERTLELLNGIMVVFILGGFLLLALFVVPAAIWLGAAAGLAGYDIPSGHFSFIPPGVDFFLLGALVAYSGAGGVSNIALANWARDRGYGMGERVGFIPCAVGGQKINLAHSGFTFGNDAGNMARWHGWWRIVRADQWGVFFTGAVLGMTLPAVVYVSLLPQGSDIQGLGIGAVLAHGAAARVGPLIGFVIAFLGAWILFKSQLDTMEGFVRAVTDMLWTGSRRLRAWRGGDIRAVYYGVLATVVLFGIVAMGLAQPIFLLKLGANVGAVILVVASLHLLYINTRLLPPHVRPPTWRRAALIAMALFYGFFVALSVLSLMQSSS